MNFHTEINLVLSDKPILHSDKIFTIGSCFAENISDKLLEHKFQVCKNPFGVLYNPVSIKNALEIVETQKIFTEEDLFFFQSEWHSFFHHSNFSDIERSRCLNKINAITENTYEFLKKADVAIVTLGTAFVYEHIESKQIVSNCHKIPSAMFNRFRLSVQEVKNELDSIQNLLKKINPNIRMIFTVSPVRHWKDGAIENSLSKAVLLLALSEALTDNSEYFPAYEIMMDDLRDYRFYDSDMIHPNKIAVEYIWEKFSERFFDDLTIKTLREIQKIIAAVSHKIRNKGSEENQRFIKKSILSIKNLTSKYQYLNLTAELNYFEKMINKSR